MQKEYENTAKSVLEIMVRKNCGRTCAPAVFYIFAQNTTGYVRGSLLSTAGDMVYP